MQKVIATLGEHPDEAISQLELEASTATIHYDELAELNKLLNGYVASEPFWILIFGFIRPVARMRVARAFAKLNLNPADWDVQNIEALQLLLSNRATESKFARDKKATELQHATQLIATLENLASEWRDIETNFELPPGSGISDFDRVADMSIRQPMFKLATHYWEGRWIMEMKNTLLSGDVDNKGIRKMERKWRRRSMLTPCAVSTLFRLPILFKAWQGNDKYLYNFIDLLIIDEAGQVLPSIGGQGFALAKSALVVGDTLQITPVRNCDQRTDAGNLIEAGITDPYDEVEKTGRTAFGGSVMRVSQTACDYHYDLDLERGMYLYDHRRCVDEIIQICNDLCYKGKLKPKRGNIQRGNHGLPRIGYCHVLGQSEKEAKNVSTSRFNSMEARAVVCFVTDNAQWLMQAYPGKTLDKIIAIVTPFSSQANQISAGLQKAGHNGVVVGTVHRMQGAEYPIVVFSPTYTRHDASMKMLDETPNMLNVAVSRAQDRFIVIGDMNVFDERSGKPSGVLARGLFKNDSNMIVSNSCASVINQSNIAVDPISTQKGHDDFLKDALNSASNEIIIVSPWISEGVLRFTGLSARIAEAVRRNVSVKVYTDKNNNTVDSLEVFKDSVVEAMRMLSEAGAEVKFVRRVHNKDVFVDEKVMCRGSFNWLSVHRAKNDDEEQIDTSFKLSGGIVKEEKGCMVNILESRLVKT